MSSKKDKSKAFGTSASSAMKQGSLFSFFSKKPTVIVSPTTAASMASDNANSIVTGSPQPAEKSSKLAIASTPPAAKTRTTAKTITVSPPSTNKKDSALAESSTDWQLVKSGTHLLVYWPEDDKYYKATATTTKGKNNSIFTLTYDDGEVERVDLKTESFKIIMSDNSPTKPPAKKKRKIQEESDDEEFEFHADDMSDQNDESVLDNEEPEKNQNEAEQWMVTDDEDTLKKPTKKRNITITKVNPKTPVSQKSPSSPFHTPSATTTSTDGTGGSKSVNPIVQQQKPTASAKQGAPIPYINGAVNPVGAHIHNHLMFLREPKDKQSRPVYSPDYDAHTLKVDFNELTQIDGKVSPAQQQWWDIKSQYFDTVLLFKTGKFYEMFHMDADVGVQVLGFAYMKGAQAHAGFPEVGYGKFSAMLVQAGYKVARVEQTETPEMLKERKKSRKAGTKTPQVMNREVCSIMTAGTRTFCYMDEVDGLMDGGNYSTSVGPLLAIKEIPVKMTASQDDEKVHPVCEYGVTIIDAVRATVTIGQFADDVLRSRMNTLLTRFQPSEVSKN